MSDTIIETLRAAPRWLIRHVCHPENHRNRKHPVTWGASSWHQSGRVRNSHPVNANTGRVRHLETNDYRFFSECRGLVGPGPDYNVITVRCRWCEQRWNLKDFEKLIRKNHKDACPYTHNLKIIYAELLLRGRCVVCEDKTYTQKWGVPMCLPKPSANKDCPADWVFNGYGFSTVRMATHALRLKGLLKEPFSQGSWRENIFD